MRIMDSGLIVEIRPNIVVEEAKELIGVWKEEDLNLE